MSKTSQAGRTTTQQPSQRPHPIFQILQYFVCLERERLREKERETNCRLQSDYTLPFTSTVYYSLQGTDHLFLLFFNSEILLLLLQLLLLLLDDLPCNSQAGNIVVISSIIIIIIITMPHNNLLLSSHLISFHLLATDIYNGKSCFTISHHGHKLLCKSGLVLHRSQLLSYIT